jgi:hypothetical protein
MPKYHKWMKNNNWLKFIRTLPCLYCGKSPSDAHHVGSRGMGLKHADSMVIPLCRMCHSSHHDRGIPSLDWCRDKLAWFWALLSEVLLDSQDAFDLKRAIGNGIDSDRNA